MKGGKLMQKSYSNTKPATQEFFNKFPQSLTKLVIDGHLSYKAQWLYIAMLYHHQDFWIHRSLLYVEGIGKWSVNKHLKILLEYGMIEFKNHFNGKNGHFYRAIRKIDCAKIEQYSMSKRRLVGKNPTTLLKNHESKLEKIQGDVGKNPTTSLENDESKLEKIQGDVGKNPTTRWKKSNLTNIKTNIKTINTPLTPQRGNLKKFIDVGLTEKEAQVVDKYLKPTERNLEAMSKCKKPASKLDLSAFFEQALSQLERAEPRGNERRLTTYQIKKLISGVYGNLAVIEMENKRQAEEAKNNNPDFQPSQ
jgi:hypothetical protein